MSLGAEKYISFTTYRKDGGAVSSPVWCNDVSDGRIGFWTAMGSGKTKRLQNNPRVTVQPCDARGRVKEGTHPVTGTAEMVRSGMLFDEVQHKGREKYGLMVKISKTFGQLLGQRKAGQTYADTVVLVRLDEG